MAEIKTVLRMVDKASSPLRKIAGEAQHTTEALNRISRKGNGLGQVRKDADQAKVGMESLKKKADDFNGSVSHSGKLFSSLKSQIGGVVGAYAGMQGIKMTLGISDELTQIDSRLNLMKDSQNTVADLNEKIFESAQRSRGSYQATADAVGKMGIMAKDAFKNNDELIRFAEQVNKQFTIAGTSVEGQEAAMLQLTQAMGSGVLRGEELNSIFEQAPTIIQAIADHMGKPVGSIRALAEEGKLTAKVVKEALLESANETDKRFNSMPKTWSQRMTEIQNIATQKFQPVLDSIGEVASSKEFDAFIVKLSHGFETIAEMFPKIMTEAKDFGKFVADNWNIIKPAITGVTIAIAGYKAAMAGIKTVNKIGAGIDQVKSIKARFLPSKKSTQKVKGSAESGAVKPTRIRCIGTAKTSKTQVPEPAGKGIDGTTLTSSKVKTEALTKAQKANTLSTGKMTRAHQQKNRVLSSRELASSKMRTEALTRAQNANAQAANRMKKAHQQKNRVVNSPNMAAGKTNMAALTGSTKVHTAATKKMSVVQKASGLAQRILNKAFLTCPVVWIVAGIAGIVTAFVLLWKKCKGFRNFWKSLWKFIKDFIANPIKTIQRGAKKIYDSITGRFKDVMNWVRRKVSAFKNLGNDIMTGLKDGIFGGLKKVKGAITDGVDWIKDKLTFDFEIGSPSRWMKRTGGFLMSGLGLGIKKWTPYVAQKMNNVTTIIKERMPEKSTAPKILKESASVSKGTSGYYDHRTTKNHNEFNITVRNEADEDRLIEKIKQLLEEELDSGAKGVYV